MSQTTQPAFQAGQLVTQPSMAAVQDAARNLVGSAIAGILGIASANSMDTPFTVTAAGGMTVTAGGSGGQKILSNSASGPRLVDAVPTQTFTVPTANGTYARKDIIYGVYTQASVSAGSGQIATLSGTTISTSSATIFNANEALTYTYATGTASASPADPSGPANSVALARITVPAGATSIVTGNVAVLLTSAQAQILSGVAGFVDLTSNQTVAGNKTFSAITTIGGMQFAHTDAAFSGVPGLRINSPGSIIVSPASPGNTISLGYDCLTLLGIYFGPVNTWGYVGPLGYNSPDGASHYGNSALITNGLLHVGASGATIGQPGDGIFERNGSSGTVFLGNSGSSYLYFDGLNYNFGPSPRGAAVVNVTGIVVSTSGYQIPNGGSQTVNGITFGNTSSGGAGTGIGSRGNPIHGVNPVIFNIENLGVSQLLALDQYGNLGIAGNVSAGGLTVAGNVSWGGGVLYAAGNGSITGSLSIGGSMSWGGGAFYTDGHGSLIGSLSVGGAFTWAGGQLFADGHASLTGPLIVNGTTIPRLFTSPDNSVSVNLSGELLTLSITNVSSSLIRFGAANSSTSSSFLAGTIFYRKRFNYGTQPASGALESSSDNNFAPLTSGLGSFSHNSPVGGTQIVQMEFVIRVIPGAGAQSVSGTFICNTPYIVFLNGSPVSSNASTSTLTQSWSATIPDNGLYNVIVLQFRNGNQIYVDHDSWSNISSSSGGIDGARFSYFGPSGSGSGYQSASSVPPS